MESKRRTIHRVKYWEIIADNLSKAGWICGCVSAVDSHGRTIWIADAHRDDGKRFVVQADELLTVARSARKAVPRKADLILAPVFTLIAACFLRMN